MKLRLIFLPGLFLCLLACKTNQKNTVKDHRDKTTITNCPEAGTCSFEVLKNKALVIKTDGTGSTYPDVVEGKQRVLKFEYKRNQDISVADDEYTEVIYAEIEPDQEEIVLKDEELSQAKLLFGRLCFCRGQTGYYPVRKGLLKIITHEDQSVTYRFNIEITEVPQVLTEVLVNQN
ncbi:hypothetical protein [Psychroflexus sediminis]|uniref:Uncharacterized protein n=1 Tax=Psychroflexus sediminis TaxID=470826 RepID=A0A1G7XYL7_9FLAO|nr:hypothetical protein [Psychroflexus sediminis]SDG89258.1 hypothetical protein SAMN04488027_11026 [Psychroflexus sediminis]